MKVTRKNISTNLGTWLYMTQNQYNSKLTVLCYVLIQTFFYTHLYVYCKSNIELKKDQSE